MRSSAISGLACQLSVGDRKTERFSEVTSASLPTDAVF
jgi:hypothetical protein